jgi:hypothetical protein
MCPEVYFQGEWFDKNTLDMLLQKPEIKRQLEEQKIQQRREQERERQAQYCKNKKLSEWKQERIQANMQKYHEEYPGEWSDLMTQKMVERAHNAVEADLQREESNKRQEEWLKQTEEQQQQRKLEAERKQREQLDRNLPEKQFERLISGSIINEYASSKLPIRTYEPGLVLLIQRFLDLKQENSRLQEDNDRLQKHISEMEMQQQHH